MVVSSSLLLLLLILLAGWGYGDSGKQRELKRMTQNTKDSSSSSNDESLNRLLDAELLQGVENLVGGLRKQHQRVLEEIERESSTYSGIRISRDSSSSKSSHRKLVRDEIYCFLHQ